MLGNIGRGSANIKKNNDLRALVWTFVLAILSVLPYHIAILHLNLEERSCHPLLSNVHSAEVRPDLCSCTDTTNVKNVVMS
ncbi:MAG: hypothetical protein KDC45_15655 [Bacteroidetes bacterium]|nr:hypothetical protein [Bacteroidota bacterium]